nr:MAG TPA: hypothetical protein [Caudoviricetes sp.]
MVLNKRCLIVKLFKNVDILDLENIMRDGILPISKTGNDNWGDGNRSNNSKDVVYLFEALNNGDSFTHYGLVLLEIDIDDAILNEIDDFDINNGEYIEYIASEVPVNNIKGIYIPKIFEEPLRAKYEVDFSEIDVKFVDVEFLVYSPELGEYVLADDEDKLIFIDTANLSTSDFNYLRGIKNNRMLDCQKKWRYMI